MAKHRTADKTNKGRKTKPSINKKMQKMIEDREKALKKEKLEQRKALNIKYKAQVQALVDAVSADDTKYKALEAEIEQLAVVSSKAAKKRAAEAIAERKTLRERLEKNKQTHQNILQAIEDKASSNAQAAIDAMDVDEEGDGGAAGEEEGESSAQESESSEEESEDKSSGESESDDNRKSRKKDKKDRRSKKGKKDTIILSSGKLISNYPLISGLRCAGERKTGWQAEEWSPAQGHNEQHSGKQVTSKRIRDRKRCCSVHIQTPRTKRAVRTVTTRTIRRSAH